MKYRILNGWNFFRGLRMIAGIAIIIQGFLFVEWLLVVTGIIFTILALLNIGCCVGGACTYPNNAADKKTEQTNYEEVV